MVWAFTIITVLGLSMGSFANSCIHRLPQGIGLVNRRSFCPTCRATLPWFTLIPLVSYLALGGRCHVCNRRISLRYLLIEILTVTLFIINYVQYGLSIRFVESMLLVVICIPVVVIDWKHFIIPSRLLVAASVLWVLLGLFTGEPLLVTGLLSGVIGFIGMALIFIGARLIFNKETLGWGDVKLGGVLSLFLGWEYFFLALWMAALSAVCYGLFLVAINGRKFFGMKIAFGSFIGGASIFVYSFQDKITEILYRWPMLLH